MPILDNSNKFESLFLQKCNKFTIKRTGVILNMEYNCRLYDYPTGSHVTVYKKTITRQEKDNSIGKKNENFNRAYQNEDRTIEAEEHCKNVSLSATKNKIYNIARSNTWEWFITLTFERENTNASDYDMITRRLHTFMNNLQKRKCPDMKYLIVPELHADKQNYHFHGLVSGVDSLRFCFSGHFDDKGNPIFNILDWKYGFTTATRVQDSGKASGYITKYITKDTELKLKNKKRYLCSQSVNRTEASFHVIDEEEFQKLYSDRITYAKNVIVPAAHQGINYYELKD